MPGVDTRVAAIFRQDRPIIPEGDTVVEEDDEVFFIAARSTSARHVGDAQGRQALPAGDDRGGGNIGATLATASRANTRSR